jgi:hypothetical protein
VPGETEGQPKQPLWLMDTDKNGEAAGFFLHRVDTPQALS